MTEIFPNKASFCAAYDAGTPQLVYRRLVNDIDTPVSAFLKLAKEAPFGFLFESVQGGEQRGRYSFLGLAPDLIWRVFGDRAEIAEGKHAIAREEYHAVPGRPLDTLRALQASASLDIPPGLPPMAAGLFGYLGYEMVREAENIPISNPDPIGTPDAMMVRPTLVAIFDQIAQEILLTTPVRPNGETGAASAYENACALLRDTEERLETALSLNHSAAVSPGDMQGTPGVSEADFFARVNRAKDYIKAGDIFQVVIGQRFAAPLTVPPFALYRSLRRLNPSPFLYFLNFRSHAIVGSSPEILVRLRDGVVTIRPIAGTRPRGKTPAEDAMLEAQLCADEKENAEHLMLLDLGRNDAARAGAPKSVRVTEKFTIERYSHVMHIVSNVEADIKPGLDAIDALMAGFPAGTVSGAPKVRAMEIIDELEEEKRGIYAGAVGYISANGDMDTAIALRTAIVKNGTMHVRAGAGIVMDSQPKAEYEETRAKARALFAAAAQAHYFNRN